MGKEHSRASAGRPQTRHRRAPQHLRALPRPRHGIQRAAALTSTRPPVAAAGGGSRSV